MKQKKPVPKRTNAGRVEMMRAIREQGVNKKASIPKVKEIFKEISKGGKPK